MDLSRQGQMRSHAFRSGYTAVELLVAMTIVAVLLFLTAAATTNAKSSQEKLATQTVIAKIHDVVLQQFMTYAERRVPEATSSVDRSIRLRRMASAEMPDSWADVRAIIAHETSVPRTPAQQVYASIYGTVAPTDEYGDAECLFMIVMQSGLADCLGCLALGVGNIDDVDGDGAFEFVDAWGNPIRFVLWPAGLELPPGEGRYFSTTAPFSTGDPAPAPGGVMRPLIFSYGPDEEGSIIVNQSGNLALGDDCGSPTPTDPDVLFGGRDDGPEDFRPDNITNLDDEAKQ